MLEVIIQVIGPFASQKMSEMLLIKLEGNLEFGVRVRQEIRLRETDTGTWSDTVKGPMVEVSRIGSKHSWSKKESVLDSHL